MSLSVEYIDHGPIYRSMARTEKSWCNLLNTRDNWFSSCFGQEGDRGFHHELGRRVTGVFIMS